MMKIQITGEFNRWLAKLKDRQAQNRIKARIILFESGYFGDVKPVGKGLYEARIHTGPGYRLYYTMRGSEIILLLIGGDKSTQQRDIQKAQEMKENL